MKPDPISDYPQEPPLADALEALPDGPLVVAFSGGLDSNVLLAQLAELPAARARKLRALHVDHGLHADSARWAEHCTRVAATLAVPIIIAPVTVDRKSGFGLEAAARDARHAVFEQHLVGGGIVALAHHRDDQAETVLLKLLRGAGPQGVGAMRRLRPLGDGWLWRPLLDCPRSELLAYAQRRKLSWIEDPSNESSRHDRNFLRNEILPRLRERWPQADANLALSAAWARDAALLIEDQAAAELPRVHGPEPASMHIAEWLALSSSVRDAVLRRWLRDLGLQEPSRAQADELLRQLHSARADRLPHVRWQQTEVRRYRELLYAMPVRASPGRGWQRSFDGTPLQLPCELGQLSLIDTHGSIVRMTDPLSVRFRRGGERILLPGRQHRSELRDLLQQAGVPPWERERLPMLIDRNDDVIAVGERWTGAKAQSMFDRLDCRLHWNRTAD